MFADILRLALDSLILFALHFEKSGSFPQKLPREEEIKLFNQMNGSFSRESMEARDKLIMHNMRLVSFIVRRKYNDSKEPAEDLVSIGSIGLVKAVSAYDVSKATPFGTYAAICIDNEIKMYFRKNNKTAGEISMSDQFGEEGGTILDKLTAEDDPFMDVISLLNSRAVYKAVNMSLNLRERRIIARRFGLNFKGKSVVQTQEQIGREMGISRAYVSRIEKTATEKLKRYFDTNGYPDIV